MKKCILMLILLFVTGSFTNFVQGQDHLTNATNFFFKQDYRNAIKEYTLELQNKPNDARVYFNIGVCHEKLNELENALNNYKIALEKDPNMNEARAALTRLQNNEEAKNQIAASQAHKSGNMAFLKKEYQTAIDEYKKVIKLTPNNFQVLYNLGVCYEQIRDFRSALSFFEKAYTINPNSQDTQNALERLSQLNKTSLLQLYRHQLDSLVDHNSFAAAQLKIKQIQKLGGEDEWVVTKKRIVQARLAEEEAKNQMAVESEIPPVDTTKTVTDSVVAAPSVQESEDNNSILIGGGIGLIAIILLVLFLRKGKQSKEQVDHVAGSASKEMPEPETLPTTNIYDLIQEHYNTKKTGILRIQGSTGNGKMIEGEIRLLNGNIVDAVTGERQGVDAVYQILEIENPTRQSLQKIQVTDTGNIRQATLPMLMKWTLGMKKEE